MSGIDVRSGVLLMTYGSPATLEREDVGMYLARIRGGREPDDDLLDEFTRRYRAIGGSPLIEITRAQAAALERRLGRPVDVGMRFSEPSLVVGLQRLVDRGVGSVLGIILSPQYSPMLMGGYARDLGAARQALGPGAPGVQVAGAWHLEPAFIQALARRIRSALGETPAEDLDRTAVLMTAHSLPRRVADQEPDYLGQLKATAQAVAVAAGLNDEAWRFCWQSAGHEPGEWMQPDFADLMPRLAEDGTRSVIVAPVQFLADHLETLYDVDIGAREQAERFGLAFRRVESLGTDDGLIEALAVAAEREQAAMTV